MYKQGKLEHEKHEHEHWYGAFQKREDALYWKKYHPLPQEGPADVGGH